MVFDWGAVSWEISNKTIFLGFAHTSLFYWNCVFLGEFALEFSQPMPFICLVQYNWTIYFIWLVPYIIRVSIWCLVDFHNFYLLWLVCFFYSRPSVWERLEFWYFWLIVTTAVAAQFLMVCNIWRSSLVSSFILLGSCSVSVENLFCLWKPGI